MAPTERVPRFAIVGGGPPARAWPRDWHGRARGRPRTIAGLALARRGRVRVAGRRCRRCATGLDRRDPGHRRPTDPGDARRDPDGTTFRLTYGADAGGEPAVGFDRSRLDPALLDLARAAGAEVRTGWTVVRRCLERGRLDLRGPDGRAHDGGDRRRRRGRASFHRRSGGRRCATGPARPAPRADLPPGRSGADRRRAMPGCGSSRDGYIGIAPVPGDGLNIGIVLGPIVAPRCARDGARAARRRGGRRHPAGPPVVPAAWRTARRSTRWRVRAPLGRRVRVGPVPAGSWSATPPGSSTRSPGKACIGPWSPPTRGLGDRRARPPAARAPRRLRACDAPAASSTRTSSRAWSSPSSARPALFERRRPAPRRAASTPCDDGPRDGRPGPAGPRPRSALPRRAPRPRDRRVHRSRRDRPARTRLRRLRLVRGRRLGPALPPRVDDHPRSPGCRRCPVAASSSGRIRPTPASCASSSRKTGLRRRDRRSARCLARTIFTDSQTARMCTRSASSTASGSPAASCATRSTAPPTRARWFTPDAAAALNLVDLVRAGACP